jgi:hypothetical protein
MAIAQLATGRVEATERPKPEPKAQNERVEKKSSTMFEESDFGGLVIMLSDLTTQLARINETAKKTVIGINKTIKSLRDLGKTIVKDFRGLNSEIAASRVNLSGLALGGDTIIEGAPMPVAPVTPEIKAGTPTTAPGSATDITKTITDVVTSMLGGAKAISALGGFLSQMGASALGSLATFFASSLGGAFLAAAGGSMLALATAIFGSAGIADKLYSYFGLDKKLKELYESEQYKQEVTQPTEQAAAAMAAKSGPQREQRQNSITEFLTSKGLGPAPKGSEIQQPGGKGSDLIRIIKPGHPDEGKTFNFKTGEEVSGAQKPAGGGAPSTPAAPGASTAPTSPPTAPTAAGKNWDQYLKENNNDPVLANEQRDIDRKIAGNKAVTPPQTSGAPEGAPAATPSSVDPEIAAKAAQYKEMGRKGIALPPEIAADPLHGKLAITAHQEGMAERNSGGGTAKPAAPPGAPRRRIRDAIPMPGEGDGARPFGSSEQQTNEALSYNPVTGEKLKGTGTSALRARARGQVLGQATREDKAGFAKISTGAGGEDYSEANKTYYIDRDIGGQKTQVPIYYNPLTDKQYSPEAGIKAAERTRPELLRGRMEQFDRQQDVDALRRGEEMRMSGSVRPLEPVVMNNSSTTNVGSSSGGETNNVSGQNLPMEVSNPALQPFIARQNVHYQ